MSGIPQLPEAKALQSSPIIPSDASPNGELDALRERLEWLEQDRAQSVERENILRDELQHRVRNMLAIIRSIFSRTVEAGQSLDDMRDHFRGRLDALARYQVARATNPQGTSYLEDMVRDELQSFEFDERIEIEGRELAVANNVAQLLSLAIHELATNSIKFGALSSADRPTRLRIHWVSTDGSLVLHWEESGVAILSSAPARSGFGREFIERALPYQLAATTSFELKPGGVSCTIAVLLDEKVSYRPSGRGWL
jgi:two-component sensor histidine kinase